ncbi:hypothetical protein R3P38DRAFT_2873169 [Favolaschia claudopus]|uniref:Uncharacterized protein n=1 Tax=Favolaschia claudopus TaxID=2862362 RepID=A0AAW0D593_9AGAR
MNGDNAPGHPPSTPLTDAEAQARIQALQGRLRTQAKEALDAYNELRARYKEEKENAARLRDETLADQYRAIREKEAELGRREGEVAAGAEELRAENETLRREYADLRANEAELDSRAQKLKTRIDEFEEQATCITLRMHNHNTQIENEYSNISAREEALERGRKLLEERMEGFRVETERLVKDAETKAEKLREGFRDAVEEKKALKAALDEAKEALDEKDKAIAVLELEVQNLTTDVDAVAEIDTEEVSRLTSALEAARLTISTQENRLKEVRAEVQESRDSAKEVSRLTSALEVAKLTISTQETALQGVQRELQNLHLESDAQRARSKEEVQGARGEISQLKEAASGDEDRYKDLEGKYDEVVGERDGLLGSKTEMEQEKQKLKEFIRKLQGDVKHLEGKISESVGRVSNDSQRISTVERLTSKAEIEALKNEVQMMKDKVQERDGIIQNLKAQGQQRAMLPARLYQPTQDPRQRPPQQSSSSVVVPVDEPVDAPHQSDTLHQPDTAAPPPLVATVRMTHNEERSLYNEFMKQFPIPEGRPPSKEMEPVGTGALESFVNPHSTSRKSLHYPKRTLWPHPAHALVFVPTHRYDNKASCWVAATALLSHVGTEVDFFMNRGKSVYYAGVYKIHSLRGLHPPGSVVPSDVSSIAMKKATKYTGEPDDFFPEGKITTECFGLQCVGFDWELYEALRKDYLAASGGGGGDGKKRKAGGKELRDGEKSKVQKV